MIFDFSDAFGALVLSSLSNRDLSVDVIRLEVIVAAGRKGVGVS